MKAKHCDECKYFKKTIVSPLTPCKLRHKPRWYSPKGAGDTDYGYKRKCDDYKKDEAK